MALSLSSLQQAHFENVQHWDTRDVITYALATGYAQNGITAQNLPYVYERDLVLAPSFATMLARNATPSVTDLGGDYSKSVLASVHANYHSPLPTSGSVNASTIVTGLLDKGIEKGVLIGLETKLHDGDHCYATVATSVMARADGGCGSFGTVANSPAAPKCIAEQTHTLFTRPDQAVLYRLLGDINPLHIDPEAALGSGFQQPIMHGLCTYGVACRGLSEIFERPISTVATRFSAPVFPGETLSLKVWHGDNNAHFELHSDDRNLRVLSAGLVSFSD